jgi:hypothetical protein
MATLPIRPTISCRLFGRCRLVGSALLFSVVFTGAVRPQQTIGGPSLEETIAYINSHSKNSAISMSGDGKILLINQYVHPCGKNDKFTCGTYYSLPVRWASEIEVRATGDFVDLRCGQLMRIEQVRTSEINGGKELDTYDHLVPFVSLAENIDDKEMVDRIGRAAQHLLALLAAQFDIDNQKQLDPNDPFK